MSIQWFPLSQKALNKLNRLKSATCLVSRSIQLQRVILVPLINNLSHTGSFAHFIWPHNYSYYQWLVRTPREIKDKEKRVLTALVWWTCTSHSKQNDMLYRLLRPWVDKLLFQPLSCPYAVFLWLLLYPGYCTDMYISGNLYKPLWDIIRQNKSLWTVCDCMWHIHIL